MIVFAYNSTNFTSFAFLSVIHVCQTDVDYPRVFGQSSRLHVHDSITGTDLWLIFCKKNMTDSLSRFVNGVSKTWI